MKKQKLNILYGCSLPVLLITILFSCDKNDGTGPSVNPISIPPELVLMDQIITHANTDEEDKNMGFSIFSPSDEIPSNWVFPVNYKDGIAHFRVSVIDKPDSRTIYYQMGFQWEGGCSGRFMEKFPEKSLIRIEDEGIYSDSLPITDFWEPGCQDTYPIDWTRKMDRMLVVIWDENFHQIDNRWGYGSNIDNIDGYFPMRVHYQVVVVPVGAAFKGWENYPITQP